MERKYFLRNSLGLLSAATIVDACKKTDSSGSGSSVASISGLNCSGAGVTAATAGTAYSGTAVVPYTGGNAATYSAGAAIASTGVTGLTATLQSGTLVSGAGNLVYFITGTASAAGTAVFALSFGGQTCSLSLAVNTAGAGSCVVAVTEVEGPYPYPSGEINNPLNRSDVRVISGTTLKTGVQLGLVFTVVNTNSSCALVSGARVDIWHCDARGYYSGYASQPGVDGTQSYVGQTWLRGFQISGADGKATFTTIYPGWYSGRATHIHFEVFIGGVLKKTGQITFLESISDAIHVSSGYSGSVNTTRNTADSIFGDSASDLAKEYASLTGSIAAGYNGTYTIGLAL